MNKTVAWILWFLGAFGAIPFHRMYCGKGWVLRLCTLNWFMIGGFMDMGKINQWCEERTIRKAQYKQAKDSM